MARRMSESAMLVGRLSVACLHCAMAESLSQAISTKQDERMPSMHRYSIAERMMRMPVNSERYESLHVPGTAEAPLHCR
eukprot:1199128-Ditylum_brightwellii.AAC.1